MAFRGRGRGRGGRFGRGGGFERSAINEEYTLFPEDVVLPSLPKNGGLSKEVVLLIKSNSRLEYFWRGSCYHLQQEAFPKPDRSKGGGGKAPEPKQEDVEIERYSDRFKAKTVAKREALESYLKQIPSNFPSELIQGAKRPRLAKKLRWDIDSGKLEDLAKLEEKYKDKDEKQDKKDEGDEEEVAEEDEEESDDGDYNQNVDFDDDEDDMNMDDEPDEDFYE